MKINPFSILPDASKTIVQYQKGQYLFHQFDTVHSVYVLISGRVQMQKTLEDGHTVVIHEALVQESFAEAALFSECYHCDCVSLSRSTVMKISKTAVLQAISDNPKFGESLIKMLSHQVQHYRQRLKIASINSAHQKVLTALSCELHYTKITELADSIGLSHEACYRALSSLVKEGKLNKLGRGRYELNR